MDIRAETTDMILPWVSALPPEIWTLIGEKIHNQKTLQALVGVCRAFRAIVSPLLYARRTFELSKWESSALSRKVLPSTLVHTKQFDVVLSEFKEQEQEEEETEWIDTYALFVSKMLKEMPNIRCFRWEDAAYEDSYRTGLMLRNSELLATLKACRSLRSLSIQFCSQYLEDRNDAQRCWLPIQGFQNLTTLELYHFYGDPTRLTKDIVNVLSECPNLKTLGLGMACDFDCYTFPEVMVLEDDKREFLEALCVRYEAKGHNPLFLHTLRLGESMCLLSSTSTKVGNFLAKLVKVSGLRTLHIYNGLTKRGSIEAETEPMKVDWSLLKDCTSLHQLSVARIGHDVRDWLNSVGKSIQELMVTERYGMYDNELKNFNALRLPNLSMLYTAEDYMEEDDREDYSLDEEGDDGFFDTDSDDEESESETWPPKPRKSTITVLDRLQDGGSQLTRLSLYMSLRTQWPLFSTHLPRLRCLTHLRLHGRGEIGPRPVKASSLWPGIHKAKDIAYRYAQLMKSKCPSLQFIRIEEWAWEVTTKGLPTEAIFHEDYTTVELRELDYFERSAIPLFAIADLQSQSGLPMSEPANEYATSEEERERVQEVIERLDERRRLRGELDGEDSSGTDEWEDYDSDSEDSDSSDESYEGLPPLI